MPACRLKMYPERVLDYIDQAIPLNPSLQTNITHIPDEDIQDTMDVVWAVSEGGLLVSMHAVT